MTGVGTVVRWRDLNSRNGSGMVASDGDPALPSFGAVKGTTKSSPRVLDRSSRAASRRPFPFTFWCAPPSAPVGLRLCCTTPMWSTRDPRLWNGLLVEKENKRPWLSSLSWDGREYKNAQTVSLHFLLSSVLGFHHRWHRHQKLLSIAKKDSLLS